ncbi:hypothetical protein [Streptomyces olivoreticuli]|uniref:hypothetical protein n=1 Tax=Streptomyces olivoreticuli TaxID=68246 RepID=UPI000E237E75|nr:hypothetical protein [Streptomyces olivoreticuli]
MSQPLAPSDGLVVPVKLSALVINKDVQERSNFQRWQANFHRLNLHLNPEADPFDDLDLDMGDACHRGIYLQWELPDALRRGTHDATTDTTSFPVVPNRWLITRRAGEATAMWIVESDHLSRTTGTSPFVWTSPKDGVRRITRIGRVRPVTDTEPWVEPPFPTDTWKPAPGSFLTANGPGIPAFSHYQPYNENVFSFHDPLTRYEERPERFTYQVVGWYSDPQYDPLDKAQDVPGFEELLKGLNWTQAGSGDSTRTTIRRSYYAGMARLVDWTPDQPVESDLARNTRVAVGNSSLDALTAMVTDAGDSTLESAPALLEALQYGMLDKIDQPDGMLDLRLKIREYWFTHGPGGYFWQITDPATGPDDGTAADVDTDERAELIALNDAQAAYDHAARELHDLRRQLYDTWWLHSLPVLPRDLDRAVLARELDPQAPESLARRVRDQLNALGDPVSPNGRVLRPTLEGSLAHNIQESIRALLARGLTLAGEKPAPEARLLKRVPTAPFRSPQDPVVLIRGAGMHEPMDTTTPLPCRPSQAVQYPGTAGDKTGSLLAAVPAPVRALVGELVCYATDEPQPPDGTIVPPPFVTDPWVQPWQPLYLEWQGDYHPVPYAKPDGTPRWTFHDDRYHWTTAPDDQLRQIDPIMLTGRCMLSAHTAFNMDARLRHHAQAHPDPDTRRRLESFAASTAEWDLMAQALSGFTAQLACHDVTRNVPPDGELRELVGPGWHAAPNPGELPAPFEGYPASPFQQIRAGQFAFTQLKIIDRFGRAHVLVEEGKGASFAAVTAQDVAPGKDEPTHPRLTGGCVHLRPGLLQGARLRFDLVDSANDSVLIDHDPGANPVCGWILPNRIEQALACYTPDGVALGELRSTTSASGDLQASWEAPPGSPVESLSQIKDIGLKHLYNFLNRIQGQGTSALTAALKSIDDTLQTVHPGNAHADTAPAVLAGRPLALVRSRLSLELDGPAITDPSWQHVLNRPQSDFPDYDWAVRLGEPDRLGDGLLAFHPDHDPDHIYTIHPPQDPTDCLRHITPDNSPRLKARHHPHRPTTPDQDIQYLTLLIDPSALIHATTGILPTAVLSLPGRFTQRPLNSLELFFRVGPLLTVSRTTSGDQIPDTVLVAPRPSLRVGTWAWAERDREGAESSLPLTPSDGRPRFTDGKPVVRNGFLTLTPADPDQADRTS